MRHNHIKELNPFLKSFLYIIGGDIAIYVGEELLNSESEDITDEDITENIKERINGTEIDFEPDDNETLKLNTVRKTLYKLYSEKLAQFRRIRDKSTGWFIYYWWHEFDLLEEILLEKKKLINSKLRDRLRFEQNNYFFVCRNCQNTNIKYNFDDAFELNFRCPDCGNQLEAQDNHEIIEFLKNKITLNQKTKIAINEN
ncbi:MAG: transcription factor [Promethearchaeota archaeon]